MNRTPLLHVACYAVSACALAGAAVYLILGTEKWFGIVAVLVAAVLSRVLILNVVHGKS